MANIGDYVSGPCVHKEVGNVRGIVYCKYPGGEVGVMAAPALSRGYACREADLTVLPDDDIFNERLDKNTLAVVREWHAKRQMADVQ